MSMNQFPSAPSGDPLFTLGIEGSTGSGSVEFAHVPQTGCIVNEYTNAALGQGSVNAQNHRHHHQQQVSGGCYNGQTSYGGVQTNGYHHLAFGGQSRGHGYNHSSAGVCGGRPGRQQPNGFEPPVCGGDRNFPIRVHAVGNNKFLNITVSPDEYVDDLKSQIRQRVDIPVDQQKLVSPGGKNMQDRTKLNCYDLKENSKVTLTTRLRGG